MRNLTFTHLSTVMDIERCAWCDKGNHLRGWADPSRGRVHFLDRKVTRSTLRTYLKLVAAVIHSHNRGQPLWRQLYEQNTYASRTALQQFGIRIPSALSDLDRARALDSLRRSKESDEQVTRWIRQRKR